MTTIATDGNTIAADGLVVAGTVVSKRNAVKLYRLDDEIVGLSGKLDECVNYMAWYRGESENPPGGDIEVVHLREDGIYTGNAPGYNLFKVDAPYTIGSGEGIAMGAMVAGVSPADAVRIAAKYDIYTGGRIRVMKL